jgi:hypothetical protein
MLVIIDSPKREILNILSLDEHNFIFARVVSFVMGRNQRKLNKGVTLHALNFNKSHQCHLSRSFLFFTNIRCKSLSMLMGAFDF